VRAARPAAGARQATLHDLGHSKKDKRFVPSMKRNLYGEVSGSRVWQEFLQTWMQSEAMSCLFSVNDRNLLSDRK